MTTQSARVAAVIAAVAATGNLLLAVAHTGADVPLLSRLGPTGGAVPPAVIAFSVGTVVFGAIAVGLWRGSSVARWAGLAICAISVASGVAQFRGVVSGFSILLAVVMAALLIRPVRTRQADAAPG